MVSAMTAHYRVRRGNVEKAGGPVPDARREGVLGGQPVAAAVRRELHEPPGPLRGHHERRLAEAQEAHDELVVPFASGTQGGERESGWDHICAMRELGAARCGPRL